MAIKTIHAGHGGIDPGAIGNGYKEADLARRYKNRLIQMTKAFDATDDTAKSVNDNLNKIVSKINSKSGNNDWNISIHLNAAASSATGVEVFAYGSDSAGMAKAAELSKKLAAIYGIPNRGAKNGSGFYVINSTKGHTLLIELGFISNANYVKQIINKQEQACKAIAESFGHSVSGGSSGGGSTGGSSITSGFTSENGTFIPNLTINVRTAPSVSAAVIATYYANQKVYYNAYKIDANGYVWIRYTRNSGGYAYMATGESKNGKRINYWGKFQ